MMPFIRTKDVMILYPAMTYSFLAERERMAYGIKEIMLAKLLC